MLRMTKRERVEAALRGAPVDRIPATVWGHNYLTENSPRTLCDETVRLAERLDLDYLKPQSRAQCFGEAWGLTYEPSNARDVRFTLTRVPLETAADLARLEPADPEAGALGEQLVALELIRARVGADLPIIWTVFSPLMVVRYLLPGGQDELLELARTEPSVLERGLEAITETIAAYATASLAHGADGIFYATPLAARGLLTADELRRFQYPYDTRVLNGVREAWFNVMHICGDVVQFEAFLEYPVAAFSWAIDESNPSLLEGHRRSGRASMGGIPKHPGMDAAAGRAVADRVQRIVREMDSRWLLIGVDCSVNPSTPDEVLEAAINAAHAIT